MNSWKVNLLLIVGRGDYGNDVLRTTLNRVHVGNRLVIVPPLPKGPEGRGGVRFYRVSSWLDTSSFRRCSLALLCLLQVALAKIPAGIHRGATRENQFSTLLLSRGAAVGAFSRGDFGSSAGPASLLPLLFRLSMANNNDHTCAAGEQLPLFVRYRAS